MDVFPAYVLSPERIRVPSPVLLKRDAEVDPEMTPLKVASVAD